MELIKRGMSLAEALAAGWTLADRAYARGYVSRRVDPMKQLLHRAGGTRAGLWYVRLPNNDSTQYYIRQYLTPPAGLLPEEVDL